MPRRNAPDIARLVTSSRAGGTAPRSSDASADHLLLALSGALQRRMAMTQAGTFDGDRNVWASCGWPIEVSDDAYELRYRRYGLARTIVDSYPSRCWARPPAVYETEDADLTEFERAWGTLVKKQQVWRFLCRLDKLAGRGSFAVMLVGFDDGGGLESEVTGASEITFLRPYHPAKVVVKETEQDKSDPRYGMPVMYELNRSNVRQTSGSQQRGGVTSGSDDAVLVHWSRILHVADNIEERDWEGRHRLESVFNHILDLEKIGGGSAEMFWRGGFPILSLLMDKMASMTDDQKIALDDETTAMFHGLSRTLRLQGIEPKFLSPSISDPKGVFEIQIQQISAATGIPTRVLLGSEQARLASEQDADNWLERVADRQLEFCEPMILRPFVSLLQRAGVLPELAEDAELIVDWPSLKERSDKEQAEVSRVQTETICKYASTPQAEAILPLLHFFTDILGWDDDKAEEMVKEVEAAREEEEAALAEAEEEAAEQGQQQTVTLPIPPKGQQPPQLRGAPAAAPATPPPAVPGKPVAKKGTRK